MLLSFILVAASQVALPSVNQQLVKYLAAHQPTYVDEDGPRAAAEVELFADDKGKVVDCSIKRLVGDADIAKSLCNSIMGRKLSRPRGFDGKPSYGLMVTVVGAGPQPSFQQILNRFGPPKSEILEISVKNVPADLAKEANLALVLAVTGAGIVSDCGPLKSKPNSLTAAACVEAKALQFDRKLDARGNAVAYVRPLTAKFVKTR